MLLISLAALGKMELRRFLLKGETLQPLLLRKHIPEGQSPRVYPEFQLQPAACIILLLYQLHLEQPVMVRN
ncbi:hypothetical protein D3C75_1110850 [compost metagenome]